MFRFFQRTQPQERKANPVGALLMSQAKATFFTHSYNNFAREGYEQNVIAHRCIKDIATCIAHVPLKTMVKKADGTLEKERTDLLDLLYKPNPKDDCFTFMEALVSQYLIAGEFFLIHDKSETNTGKPVELWTLNPQYVTVKPGQSGMPSMYIFKVSSAERRFPVDPITGQSGVLHVRNYNPRDEYRGLSAMVPGAYSIDIHNSISKWNQSGIQNAAMPSGALMVKGENGNSTELTEEQFNRLQEQIDTQMSGERNAQKPLLLEGGMEWVPMSLSPKEMDYIKNNHEVSRQIAQAFNYPPLLLGLPGDNTYANYKEARMALYENTVLPLLDKFCKALTQWLSQYYGDNIVITYEDDDINALEPKRQIKYERIKNADWLTINEKREAFGLEPLDGGDTLYQPAAMLPLGFTGELDEEAKLYATQETEYKRRLKRVGCTDAEIKELLQQTYPNAYKASNFPNQGDDKEISLNNSNHQQAPYDFIADIKEDYPEMWSGVGDGGEGEDRTSFTGKDAFRAWTAYREGDRSESVLNWVKRREAFLDRMAGNVSSWKGMLAVGMWGGVPKDGGARRLRNVLNEQKEKVKESRSG